jgi:hypothetical protein
MLLTNVTRSASYETLPNHRLFPARSGLTNRSPICLWHLRSNKSGDAVGRPSCRSSLLGDPGAKFLVETGDPNRTMKNSLNYVSTCLRVVDTRRSTLSSAQQALERKLNNPFLHIALYQIAFLQNDAAVMTQQVAWSVGKPGVEQPHPPPSATINL